MKISFQQLPQHFADFVLCSYSRIKLKWIAMACKSGYPDDIYILTMRQYILCYFLFLDILVFIDKNKYIIFQNFWIYYVYRGLCYTTCERIKLYARVNTNFTICWNRLINYDDVLIFCAKIRFEIRHTKKNAITMSRALFRIYLHQECPKSNIWKPRMNENQKVIYMYSQMHRFEDVTKKCN